MEEFKNMVKAPLLNKIKSKLNINNISIKKIAKKETQEQKGQEVELVLKTVNKRKN